MMAADIGRLLFEAHEERACGRLVGGGQLRFDGPRGKRSFRGSSPPRPPSGFLVSFSLFVIPSGDGKFTAAGASSLAARTAGKK